ncbi:hypothetical protein ACFWX8_44700, partial [Streptomyces violascens]
HVHRVLTGLAADGTSVVLSSHRMDDLEALCSEVTILAFGRVVFSGPLGKLAAENRELDYRLLTSDAEAARRLAAGTEGIRIVDDSHRRHDPDILVVRAQVPALDEFVRRLVLAGTALRELTPVVSPLEAAFLSLTEQPTRSTGSTEQWTAHSAKPTTERRVRSQEELRTEPREAGR